MSAIYGVSLDTTVAKLNQQFRILLLKRGGIGIRTLEKIFLSLDVDSTKKLNFKAFEIAIAQVGLFPKIVDIQALFKYYDRNNDGFISYEEFLSGIREPLNERRKNIIFKAFYYMDPENKGSITVDDIKKNLNADKYKEYVSGLNSTVDPFQSFFDNFPNLTTYESKLSQSDFVQFHEDLSLSIAEDNSFVSMVESIWNVIEKGDFMEESQTVAKILNELREMLKSTVKKPHLEEEIKKIFNAFDSSEKQFLTIHDIEHMLTKLKFPIEKRYLHLVFKHIDKNRSAAIEFNEFSNYLRE